MIEFHQSTHQYKSSVPDNMEWLSVTKIIGALCPPFDAYKMSQLCSKKRKSKWYGMDPADIRAAWDGENKRSTDLGHWYHNLKEQEHLQKENVVAPIFRDDVKIAPFQQLKPGMCYPEHLVYLSSVGIAGQVDYPEVTEDNVLNITDYKGLALDTIIPTLDGFKTMLEIEKGDIIFDGEGKLTTVVNVSEIHYNPCYKITFDTNDSVVCDHEHKWVISVRKNIRSTW